MEKKKQSSSLAIPFALIGGGIAMFITTTPVAFFVGAAVGVVVGYILSGMADQAHDENQNNNNA